jgi:hypothetical protein
MWGSIVRQFSTSVPFVQSEYHHQMMPDLPLVPTLGNAPSKDDAPPSGAAHLCASVK